MANKPLSRRQRELLDHLRRGRIIRGASDPYTGAVHYTVYDKNSKKPLDIFSRAPVNALLARNLITVSEYVVSLAPEA